MGAEVRETALLVACYSLVVLACVAVLLVLAPALCWGLVWLNGWGG